MVRRLAVSQEDFDAILEWLSPDREKASSEYLKLRGNLETVFEWNRCDDPEGLTDEVFDRVAGKIRKVRESYQGDPKRFFYGVARNLIKEHKLKANRQVPLEDYEAPPADVTGDSAELVSIREDCLQECLGKLDQESAGLIVGYYAGQKQAKIDQRAKLAGKYRLTIETLRVRAFRIRAKLELCIRTCLSTIARTDDSS
jgi:DNA-directed RNA polymerase specialized sigma24 family protein